ncbi:glycosyltransferase [Bacteroides sp. 41_26]|uniref:glycosyltransferase n=1 Tax=Bacteroides sp. 41_26 TaxID=1896973 RepID=UPI00259CB255|nr:glycosyltransferase [Bacteroides sp. 41_26]
MKNILFFCTRYPGLGGIEKVTEYLANELSSGYNVSIFSASPLVDESLLQKLNSSVDYFYSRTSLKEDILHVLDEGRIDFFIYQDSYYNRENEVLAAIKNAKKKPVLIVVEHNTPDCYLISNKLSSCNLVLKRIKRLGIMVYTMYRHRKMYRMADKYVLLSKRFVPIFKKITFIRNPKKLMWINNPTTCDIPIEIDFKSKEKLCVFSGRLVPQKGIHLLLEIWNRVSKLHPDWKLKILGDGEKREWMEQYVVNNNLQNTVTFEGFQVNVEGYYKRASILTMTSIYEGWLLSLCESMQYGCLPMLFASYQAAYDIVDNGYNGILVDAFDIEKYVNQLDTLMTDSNKLRKMQIAAIDKASHFYIQNIGDKWRKLLNTFES